MCERKRKKTDEGEETRDDGMRVVRMHHVHARTDTVEEPS